MHLNQELRSQHATLTYYIVNRSLVFTDLHWKAIFILHLVSQICGLNARIKHFPLLINPNTASCFFNGITRPECLNYTLSNFHFTGSLPYFWAANSSLIMRTRIDNQKLIYLRTHKGNTHPQFWRGRPDNRLVIFIRLIGRYGSKNIDHDNLTKIKCLWCLTYTSYKRSSSVGRLTPLL